MSQHSETFDSTKLFEPMPTTTREQRGSEPDAPAMETEHVEKEAEKDRGEEKKRRERGLRKNLEQAFAAQCDLMRITGQALAHISEMHINLVRRFFSIYRPVRLTHVDSFALAQLGRLMTSRWMNAAERLSQLPKEMAHGDTDRMSSLISAMSEEYIRDFRSLPPEALTVDFRPLARAFAKAYSDRGEEAVRIAERFVDALAVKASYGPEYYADPQGTDVGTAPREVAASFEGVTLYRYKAKEGVAQDREAAPVLIVYSVINRPYILDLAPGMSFVEHLLERGLEVYLVDWGETRQGDNSTTLDSYLDPMLTSCLRTIRDQTGAKTVSLFGHCIGGVLATMYAALYPEQVDRLVTLTTPITAPQGGVVALWTDRVAFPVDSIVEAYGHVPGKLIRYTFMALKPYFEITKWKLFVESLDKDDALDVFRVVDRWANDNVDIPGLVFKKFIDELYHEDRFCRGLTRIHGQRVDLGKITQPLLNITASKDWIVPPPSASILGQLVGSKDNRHLEIDGNHVAIIIDPRHHASWSEVSSFLKRDAHKGVPATADA